MTYLLIDRPIKITDEAEPNTLCLKATSRPDIWVASSRFLIVVSLGKGVTEIPLENDVWDVSLGWHFKPGEEWSEELHTPYVLPQNIGKSHTEITFRKKIGRWPHVKADSSLFGVMATAPRFDRPGGFRGSEESKKALQYPRGVKAGDALWLTPEAAEKLRAKIGTPAKRNAMRDYLSRLIMEDEG